MEEKEKNGEKNKDEINNKEDSSFTKMIYIILLYVFYLFGGLYNERLTKTEYEYIDENNKKNLLRFKYPTISLCFPSILSFCISSFMLRKMKNKYFSSKIESPISFMDKSIIGIFHIISSFTAQTALIYLDFIVKTIGKSCKSASIMFIYFLNTIPCCNKLLKKLLNNNTKEEKKEKILMKDVIKVLMTTTSVILFNLSSKDKKSNNNDQSNSYFGIAVLLISLFTDGLLSLKENMIKTNIISDKKYEGYNNLLSWEYMNIFSFFTFMFSFSQIISNLYFGNYIQIFKIIFTNKILLRDLLSYAVFDVMGQSILYIFLGKYGPLALSMVTSVRKILSISISILYFGKSISFPQSISLFLATYIIFWEIYEKGNKKEIKKKKNE
jgi:UDP-galactose transporter B1